MKKLLLSYKIILFIIAILFSFNEIKAQTTFNIYYEQLKLTCSNGNNAEVRVWASNESIPYIVDTTFHYKWLSGSIQPIQLSENNQYVIGLRAYTQYVLEVTHNNIVQTDTIILRAYSHPSVEIYSDPDSIVYLDNPYVKWGFNLTDPNTEITNFYWKFTGYEESVTSEKPTMVYSESNVDDNGYTHAMLTVYNEQGCDTTFNASIKVDPVKLKIPNIFTPNGDGTNDYFEIGYDNGEPINDLNRYFLSHKLVIFNRWGRIVYESKDYRNDWDGGNLPDGTYFYVLDCKGKTQNYNYKGSVMIWNSGR